jgi:hypothetical protein
MANFTIYYPDAEMRDAAKGKLAELAASFGMYTVHESQKRGNVRELLESITTGEMVLLFMADEQKSFALTVLDRLLATLNDPLERDAIETLSNTLRDSIGAD